MRLIDADEFTKQIAGMAIANGYPADKANKMCELIDCQPTAYDVDKVVEQMEELASCEESRAAEYDEAGKIDRMNIHDGKAAAYKNTIRIIKSGGVE